MDKKSAKTKASPAPKRKVEEPKVTKVVAKKKKVEVEEDDNDDDDDDDDNDDDDEDEEDDDDDGDDDDDDGDDDDDEDNDDDDDNDDNDDDDEDDKKGKKKSSAKPKAKASKKPAASAKKAKTKAKAKAKKAASKSKSKSSSKSSASSTGGPLKLKQLTTLERLEEARKAFKWWEAESLPEGINWRSLEHSGMVFAPAYVPHGVPMKYNGEVITLTPEQEEMATFYAAIPDDGPQLGNQETRPVFQKNFFDEFKTAFPDKKIKEFSLCDFTQIKQHLELQKNLRKAATDEEKEAKKAEKEKLQLKHAFALVDGRLEKVGNYNMEPPGLFRGRGNHPKTGTIKKRAFAESVSLNLSMDACVPKCPLPGHAWESVRHDPAVTWLCTWTENVQSQFKYVMLAASSSFKGKSDQDKYGTAIKLKGCIEDIRRDYIANLDSNDLAKRQLGTAMWVIDRLALRVGGEKSEQEADTVGCCSLRREHLKFFRDIEQDVAPAGEALNYEIELEFLGKDSMLYKQTIDFSKYGAVGIKVYNCLRSFCKGKEPGKGVASQVFETLSPESLNKHLSSILPGLTAKVFRTYNASITLQEELPSAESLAGLSIQEKVAKYNAANREVAILCNHQKTVSKAAETMFENLNEKLTSLQKQKRQLQEWLKLVQGSKKIPLKQDDKDIVERLQERVAKAQKRKEAAKTTEEKLAAAQELEDARAEVKKDQGRRFEEKHMFKQQPSAESLKSRIQKWAEDITKLELDIRNRDENKEVALGTSKINYMDPRISVAWCKRCEVPIDKIFPKTLRDKFNWAMAVDLTWKFE